MDKLRTNQIISTEIPNAIEEIQNNPEFVDFAEAVAYRKGWAIGDTIEAIATHIVILDEDYELEDEENE